MKSFLDFTEGFSRKWFVMVCISILFSGRVVAVSNALYLSEVDYCFRYTDFWWIASSLRICFIVVLPTSRIFEALGKSTRISGSAHARGNCQKWGSRKFLISLVYHHFHRILHFWINPETDHLLLVFHRISGFHPHKMVVSQTNM